MVVCTVSTPSVSRLPYALLSVLSATLFSACGSLPPAEKGGAVPAASAPAASFPVPSGRYVSLSSGHQAQDVVITALGLIDTGYRFGGKNPEAGLDCSGMVSYVYEKAAGVKLPHNAALIAGLTRPISRERMQPGDLVFFNTDNRPFSHVGLYIGEGRFVHAPSSRGQVQISSLNRGWFANRFQTARTLVND